MLLVWFATRKQPNGDSNRELRMYTGPGEMAQRLRMLPALLEVLRSISSHMVAHNHL